MRTGGLPVSNEDHGIESAHSDMVIIEEATNSNRKHSPPSRGGITANRMILRKPSITMTTVGMNRMTLRTGPNGLMISKWWRTIGVAVSQASTETANIDLHHEMDFIPGCWVRVSLGDHRFCTIPAHEASANTTR